MSTAEPAAAAVPAVGVHGCPGRRLAGVGTASSSRSAGTSMNRAVWYSVILTVAEMKRLARNASELMTLSAALHTDGIQLELLTGPLTGIYDPTGMGSMLFAVLAVAAQLDRDYIREKTLEGQQAAAARGRHGGRPPVIDLDSLVYARALQAAGTPVPDIAKKLTIKTGKNIGQRPSVASVYRALAVAAANVDLTS